MIGRTDKAILLIQQQKTLQDAATDSNICKHILFTFSVNKLLCNIFLLCLYVLNIKKNMYLLVTISFFHIPFLCSQLSQLVSKRVSQEIYVFIFLLYIIHSRQTK